MKNIQHISTNHSKYFRMSTSNYKTRTPKPKNSTGSVTELYPIILDDGRTIIYTSDKSKESEIRSRYALRKLL